MTNGNEPGIPKLVKLAGVYQRVAEVASKPPKTRKADVLLRFWLKMSKNAFCGTDYFKNSRGSMPPDPLAGSGFALE